jgi:hypothetical protein
VRADVKLDSPVVRRVADKHGNLHRNRAAFDEIEGILTGQDIVVKDQGSLEPQVAVPELLISGDRARRIRQRR